MLVAVVDDDASVRAATGSLVRAIGWAVRSYACAEDFLADEQARETSCLVCDIQMPGMDGIELLARLQAAGREPPTVFITALLSAAVRERALRQGGLCVMEKPVDAEELEAWLWRATAAAR